VVSFIRLNESALRLEVHDNDVGFPRGCDFRAMSPMGMSIIRTLTDQISGAINFDGSTGAQFSIAYPG
jgi:two-component sensor histidine kinase